MREADKSILDAIRHGENQKVLNQLYDTILPKVRSYIMKNSGTMEDVKDIFQDGVLILYDRVKKNQFNESFEIGAYVYTVCKNLWINKVTRRNRVKTVEQVPEVVEEAEQLESLLTEEKMKLIEKLFEQIGEPCRTLLKMNIFENLSMQEIVEKMEYASTNVAKTYTYRCRKKLADLISNNDKFKELFDK